MSEAKTEHYVPKSYLKRFARDGKSIFTFDKFAQRVFRTSIENVACENYFYDFPKEEAARAGIDPQIVEKELSKIEGGFSNTVDAILKSAEASQGRMIQDDQKLAMAYFITAQQLRTRETRNLFTEMRQRFGEALLSKMPDVSPDEYQIDEYQIEVNETEVSLSQSGFLFHPEILNLHLSILCDHIWFVGINDTEHPFYTSDNPVVRRGHYGEAGLASRGIEIAFPLNPKYVLVLCEKTAFAHYASLDCMGMALNSDNITYYNYLQVAECHRQVFCPLEDFELARQICSEHPQVCSPDRPRIQVV
jgi:hypothetical protein